MSDKPLKEPSLLIIGGDGDFNLMRFLLRCNERNIGAYPCLIGKSGTPSITYDLKSDQLIINKNVIKPRAAFIRPNVFDSSGEIQVTASSRNWFNVCIGWLLAHDEIQILNRQYFNRPKVNKLHTLILAKQIGFEVPETYLTNSIVKINSLLKEKDFIQKPVDGGDLCKPLSEIPAESYHSDMLSSPFIVQEKLEQPEIRIFRIGSKYFAYKVSFNALDYRESNSGVRLEQTEPPAGLVEKLEKLCDYSGLNFAAADFKSCPKTKSLLFLELNSGPMFVGFDQVSNFELVDAMIDFLVEDTDPV